MSHRMNEMPACFGTFGSVRARTKIQSAHCAAVIHVFVPLMTYVSPRRSARVCSDARS
jgi:hypothetical protein